MVLTVLRNIERYIKVFPILGDGLLDNANILRVEADRGRCSRRGSSAGSRRNAQVDSADGCGGKRRKRGADEVWRWKVVSC